MNIPKAIFHLLKGGHWVLCLGGQSCVCCHPTASSPHFVHSLCIFCRAYAHTRFSRLHNGKTVKICFGTGNLAS